MRQLILLSFLFLTLSFIAGAQINRDWCGTHMEELWGNNRTPTGPCFGPPGLCGTAGMNAFIPDSTIPMKYFFFSIAVVDSGVYHVNQADVDSMMARFNRKFWNPWRISACYSTVFIDTSQMSLYATNPDSFYYVVIYDWPTQGSAGSNIKIDYTVVTNNDYRSGLVLAHELGHFVGLRHTWEYSFLVPASSPQGCPQGCRDRVEYALSAQDTVGDFVPDTPPTPVNYVCAPPAGVDSCSAGYPAWPNWGYANVMQYNNCPNAVFTPQQAGKAHCAINYSGTYFTPRLVYGMQHCSLITGTNDFRSHKELDLKIIPNPFTTTATVSFGREVHDATFFLYNLLGEKVAETSGINSGSLQLNRASLQSGVYVFEIREDYKSIARGKAVVY